MSLVGVKLCQLKKLKLFKEVSYIMKKKKIIPGISEKLIENSLLRREFPVRIFKEI